MTLDYGSNDEMNQRALAADKLFCVTSHDKVRVQFLLRGWTVSPAATVRPAFRAALPESLLRLQRREYYRLTTPIARPFKCLIPIRWPQWHRRQIEANVIDISGGGLAVMVPPAGLAFEPGMEFHNCRIELPEVGIIVSTLQVRNVFDVTLAHRRAGHARRLPVRQPARADADAGAALHHQGGTGAQGARSRDSADRDDPAGRQTCMFMMSL